MSAYDILTIRATAERLLKLCITASLLGASIQVVAAAHVPTRGTTGGMKPGEIPSQFPNAPIVKNALLNLIAWVTQGVAPPHTPLIERKDGEILRDAFGNAKGGMRTPYVDVPTVRYIASAPLAAGDDRSRAQKGIQEPIPVDRLKGLYQTRAGYLKRFDQAMDKMVTARLIQTADGEKLKAEEAKNPPF
jgi:hypothetical protein